MASNLEGIKMISENDKQAILGGAYGVSRGGVKVKFIGMTNNTDYPYQFITLKIQT